MTVQDTRRTGVELLRDPRIVLRGDAEVAALIAAYLTRRPEVETVPRGAYLSLFALWRKAVALYGDD